MPHRKKQARAFLEQCLHCGKRLRSNNPFLTLCRACYEIGHRSPAEQCQACLEADSRSRQKLTEDDHREIIS